MILDRGLRQAQSDKVTTCESYRIPSKLLVNELFIVILNI